MFLTDMSRGQLVWRTVFSTLFVTFPFDSGAQEPVSNIGLPAVAAIGFHGGFARLERSSDGQEGGLFIDLGWLRGRSVRLQAEIAMLRATLTETLVLEDSTFHGDYYDLSAGVSAVWLLNRQGPVSPYGLAGIAVHALSSSFGNSVLDQRYNTNRFGSHIGAGVRLRAGSARPAIFAEVRRVISDHVDRTAVRFGAVVLLGDLYRRATGIHR